MPSEKTDIAGDVTAELGVASAAEATNAAVRSEALPIRVEAASRAIPAQMHDIARRLPDGVVEVTLSPEELGRVRVSMQASESGMTVQITAERPETLELMRRHIDVLAGELRGQGHTGLAFSFAQNGKDHSENETRNQSVPDDNMPDAPLPKTTATLRDAGRLDLRL